MLEKPADWPNGTTVVVEPEVDPVPVGMREQDWDTSSESITDWLRWYDALEPLELTAADKDAIAAWRKVVRDYTLANADKGIEGLFP